MEFRLLTPMFCACTNYSYTADGVEYVKRILHECSCITEFIKRVGEKISARLCRASYWFSSNEFNKSIIEEQAGKILFIIFILQ